MRKTVNYQVRELTQDEVKVKSTTYASTSSIVDGFTISFTNAEAGFILPNKTGWISNEGQENELYGLDPTELDGLSTNWELVITPDREGDLTNFIRTDHDYELYFVDPADSTYRPPLRFGGGFSRINIPVFVRNLMTGELADMFVLDNDDNDELSPGDALLIAERDDRVYNYRFMVSILPTESSTAPSPGDKIRISTSREFGSDDSFQFAMRAGSVDNELAKDQLENIYVVPNPYRGGILGTGK